MLVLPMIRPARWDQPLEGPWRLAEDIPADPLADFANTTNNTLSVWLVDDDLTNLRRVVTAMAASREKIDKFDYVLFPFGHLVSLQLQVVGTPGDTPDDAANF